MGYRLTSGERRIIERSKRDAAQTPPPDGLSGEPEKDPQTPPLWRSALGWVASIVFLVALAMFLLWLASLI
jgi:hypothetical protein